MTTPASSSDPSGPAPALWLAMLLPALAAAMGWGIRGQYGHETGAMIAGLLVGLTLLLLFRPHAAPLTVARAAALCTAAIGFGGAMTYGQTIGLTQNAPVVGNGFALAWGMLGLGIKGAIWIGFAGAFLGMGLSGIRYHIREMALLLGALLAFTLLGTWLLNTPFDPPSRLLPRIYFSADWSWYPSAGPELKPRREIWGGLLFALVALVLYLTIVRRDRLARNLALWACLGGLGFPIGQSLQAWHAWNIDIFSQPPWANFDRIINWWNFMETTFGFVFGAALGLGLWLNRRLIAPLKDTGDITLRPIMEWMLFVAHCLLIFTWEFTDLPFLEAAADLGIPTSLLPLLLITSGRLWPFLMILPVVALPILGKTATSIGFPPATPSLGSLLLWLVPFLLLTALAARLARRTVPSALRPNLPSMPLFVPQSLLLVTWLYFSLNYAFFKFPWPWQTWTARTPNAIVFTLCALALSWAALKTIRQAKLSTPPLGSSSADSPSSTELRP